MKTYEWLVGVSLILMILLTGCSDNYHPIPYDSSGKMTLSFQHEVDGKPLVKNEMIYVNAAGNLYMITELKYFISDITLFNSNGTTYLVNRSKDIFYVDDDIPSTHYIELTDNIPSGSYDSIHFTFGINEEKNKTNAFVNPPESNMFWPEVLGGGYHYMMLNGRWTDTLEIIQPFNFHLGIGQLYHGSTHNVDSIYAFVQNYFTVSLPNSSFTMNEKGTVLLTLTMHIESWFDTPNVYNHNQWGGAIMQNQAAMDMIKQNGWNVFSVSIKEK